MLRKKAVISDAHSSSRRASSFSITSTLKADVKAGAQPQLAKVVLDTVIDPNPHDDIAPLVDIGFRGETDGDLGKGLRHPPYGIIVRVFPGVTPP